MQLSATIGLIGILISMMAIAIFIQWLTSYID
jgi:hypothetical protein